MKTQSSSSIRGLAGYFSSNPPTLRVKGSCAGRSSRERLLGRIRRARVAHGVGQMNAEMFVRLSGAVLHLNAAASHERFGRRAVDALGMLFGDEIDSCSIAEIDLQAMHATMISSDMAARTPFHSNRWSELTTSEQVLQIWSAMRVGQVTVSSEFEPNPDHIRRPPGVIHRLILPFIWRDKFIVSVGCNRNGRKFDDRHRRLLSAFGPHLALAYDRVEKLSSNPHADVITDRGLKWVWPGSVVVAPHGNILSMTRGAAAILRAYFGPFPPHSSQLPAPVRDWIRELITQGQRRPLRMPAPRAPLQVTRGQLELTLRLSGLEADGQLSLQLRHAQPIRTERIMIDLGTTQRETEVVCELIHTNSQREVADNLGMSPNTVRTHRQNIYEKLGVNDRVGLVMKVQELLTKCDRPEPLRLPAWSGRLH